MVDKTNKTYLVTGAAGFIGSNLVDMLLRRGARVIGVDNFDSFYNPSIKWSNIEDARRHSSYRLVEGDIRNRELMNGLMKDEPIDSVIHLAARAGVRPSIEDPLLYQSVNIEGTSVVLEAVREAGIRRLLFASSSSVYGNNKSLPFRESDNVDMPISPYAATKKAGELLCATYNHLYAIEIACLRFFTVYGPRQRPEMAIHKFVRRIAGGESITMFGDGSTARDYTYIEDIIQGILSIEENFKGYGIFNLGESETTTLKTLIELISNALGCEAKIDSLPMQPGDVDITYADISSARALGYRPVTPIGKGVEEFVQWFKRSQVEATQE